jgi:hypothetical protein
LLANPAKGAGVRIRVNASWSYRYSR